MDASVSIQPRSAEMLAVLREQAGEIRKLASRDREVRAHEQAHAAVGGAYASHPHYQYEKGPNGVSYAVSGHVNIDVSAVPGDPEATLKKMQVVQRAAMAPANPSAADRAVAADAAQKAVQARAELSREPTEDLAAGNTNTVDLTDQAGAAGSLLDLIA